MPLDAKSCASKHYISAEDVPVDASPHDILYYRAATFSPAHLQEYREWFVRGRDCSGYLGPKPRYQLSIDWRECEEDSQVEIVNCALVNCFGPFNAKHWSLWIKGDRVRTIVMEFRAEYVRAVENKLDVGVLDEWILKLSEAFKFQDSLEGSTFRGRGRQSLAGDGLGIPSLRRSSRSPSPTHRNIDQHPEWRGQPVDIRGSRPSDKPLTEEEFNAFLNSVPTSGTATSLVVPALPDFNNDKQSNPSNAPPPTLHRSKTVTPQSRREDSASSQKKTPSSARAAERPSTTSASRIPVGSLDTSQIFDDYTPEEEFVIVDSSTPSTPSVSKRTLDQAGTHSGRQSKKQKPAAAARKSSGVTTPVTPKPTHQESDDSPDETTPRPRNENGVEAYYKKPYPDPATSKTSKGGISWKYPCRHCTSHPSIKGKVNSNLHTHIGRCPGLQAAIQKGSPGIPAAILIKCQNKGPTINPATGKLQAPFNLEGLRQRINNMIIALALPFNTVENEEFRELLQYCQPAAKVHSRNTVRSDVQALYATYRDSVDEELKNVDSTIHWAHDSWTDSERRNCYFALVAFYVDSNFCHREVLVRFLHMSGAHTGERIGNGIYETFDHIGIANRVGPGTGDNASNNYSAAAFLTQRLRDEAHNCIHAAEFVGCMCHIANLAARDFLDSESCLDMEDYVADPAYNIPELRIIGVSSTWSFEPQPEEDSTEEETEELPGGHDGLLDEDDLAALKARKRNPDAPVVMVHRLARFVLASAGRRADFEVIRKQKNPGEGRGIKRVLLKDVPTRWNSTFFAIQRAIHLKETIIAYTSQYHNSHCPRFTRDTFKALEEIMPTLEEFMKITHRYSTSDANVYRVLSDLHLALENLKAGEKKAAKERKRSFKLSRTKLQKYMDRYLANDWICAAFALDSRNREKGLASLFAAYNMSYRTTEVVAWIKAKASTYQEPQLDEPEEAVRVLHTREESPSPFEEPDDEDTSETNNADFWEEYNSPNPRAKGLSRLPDETVLQFWKRQESNNPKLRPLCRLVRDVLGLAPSSTCVERVFSQAGHMMGRKRGSLSASAMVQQTAVKLWMHAKVPMKGIVKAFKSALGIE